MATVTSTSAVISNGADTSTPTVTINAAFLQEIKADNNDLRRLLGATLASLTGRVIHVAPRVLVERLGELRDQLALHFSLEEAYGYFEDAIDSAPQLGRRAQRLRAQHRELFVELCDIEEQAEQLLYREISPRGLQDVAAKYRAFYYEFLEHESRENDLIMTAFAEDIGEGD